MQDFTGVPAVVDLAAMRDGIMALGGDPQKINPLNPVDLVIDHSVMVDEFGTPRAFQLNVDREYERNIERYQFLKWGQSAFDNFRVVPPGTGICHQVNLEYLAQTVWTDTDPSGALVAYPDTLVGTDSHTTMVNGLAVLGWGVGGIEAEAAMLGQPVSMLIPEVVGFKLTGKMVEGTTATDLVLKVVADAAQEGRGRASSSSSTATGLDHLPLADRATIGNMAPEYGATCGFFPIDDETLRYLRQTGRDEDADRAGRGLCQGQRHVARAGLRAGLHRHAAPRHGRDRPGDRRAEAAAGLHAAQRRGPRLLQDGRRLPRHRRLDRRPTRWRPRAAASSPRRRDVAQDRGGRGRGLHHPRRLGGDRGDHLLHQHLEPLRDDRRRPRRAQGARARAEPQAVGQDLAGAGQPGGLASISRPPACRRTSTRIGFNLAGYGCTTCIGNSGPLGGPEISKAIADNDLVATAVLSGNRNFEGRISPDVRANYLASPPLVVAYALAGDLNINLTREPLGQDQDGKDVYLKDIWPTNEEIAELVEQTVTREAFQSKYADVFKGDEKWQAVETADSETYDWPPTSTYIQNPPYFQGMSKEPGVISDITGARILALLGDMVTTDHIRPRGLVQADDAGRQVPDGAADRAARLQLLRLAARQPRGDDARHLRQHPHQERDARRRRGRLHQGAGRRADLDLRRGDGLAGRGRAAGRLRRRRVRRRLVARLGGEGHGAPRGQGGDRRELRAHPPLEPRRHGGDPLRVHRRRQPQDPRAEGRRGRSRSPASRATSSRWRSCPAPSPMPTARERTIELKCRIDTAVEIEYVENGGVLHYVLRNLARS